MTRTYLNGSWEELGDTACLGRLQPPGSPCLSSSSDLGVSAVLDYHPYVLPCQTTHHLPLFQKDDSHVNQASHPNAKASDWCV